MKRILFAVVFLASVSRSWAEEPAKATPLPQSGTIASSGGGGTSKSVGSWEPPALEGNGSAPLNGSVSRVNAKQWIARVYNNSEDAIRATFQVIQLNKVGARLKTDTLSFSLPAKGKAEQTIASANGTDNCELNIVSWSGPKKKPEPTGTTSSAPVKK